MPAIINLVSERQERASLDATQLEQELLEKCRDAFDRLSLFKTRHGLPTWERALEALLDQAAEVVAP